MRLLLAFALIVLSLATPAAAGQRRVLFDQGHGQAFKIEDEGDLQLGRLAEILRNDNWQVESSTSVLTPDLLTGVDALVISGAFRPLSNTEIDAVGSFLSSGGKLAVMLHIAPPLVSLLDRLGVACFNGVVREHDADLILGGEPLYFKVTRLEDHPLNRDLEHVAFYGVWPMQPLHEGVTSIEKTSPSAWLDLDRDQKLSAPDVVQEFAVLVTGRVGNGEFAVFGDDAIFQNRFLQGENITLAQNLSRWLTQ